MEVTSLIHRNYRPSGILVGAWRWPSGPARAPGFSVLDAISDDQPRFIHDLIAVDAVLNGQRLDGIDLALRLIDRMPASLSARSV